MSHTAIRPLLLCAALLFSSCTTSKPTLDSLGSYPLCEASAATTLPCPNNDGECLIVADNEQNRALFSFATRHGQFALDKQTTLDLGLTKDNALSDIEALLRLDENIIVAFGSHSRNTKCQKKKKRRRIATIDMSQTDPNVLNIRSSKTIRCESLFSDKTLTDQVVRAICRSINHSERSADKIEQDLKNGRLTKKKAKRQCNQITPFNAEGAVAIPSTKGADIWVGLRAPLLTSHPTEPKRKNLAILLRMQNLNGYVFDKAALLDLDGRGIRELSLHEDKIWVISGPPTDQAERFKLHSFSPHRLQTDQIIKPDLITKLPKSSEGLAFSKKKAYVLTDGDTGKGKARQTCKKPSKFLTLDLP